MATGKTSKDRAAAQERERARVYQARLALHESQRRRRRRDNIVAAVVAVVVVTGAIGFDAFQALGRPGSPSPASTPTPSPSFTNPLPLESPAP